MKTATENECSAALSDLIGAIRVFGHEDPRTEVLREGLRGLLAAYSAAHSRSIFGVPQYCGTREALRRAGEHLRERLPPEEVERVLGPAAAAAAAAVEAAQKAVEAAQEAVEVAEEKWMAAGRGRLFDDAAVSRPLWAAVQAAAQRRNEAAADLAEARRKL